MCITVRETSCSCAINQLMLVWVLWKFTVEILSSLVSLDMAYTRVVYTKRQPLCRRTPLLRQKTFSRIFCFWEITLHVTSFTTIQCTKMEYQIEGRCGAVGSASDSLSSSRGFEPLQRIPLFTCRETLPSLLSTGLFKELIVEWFHNRTKNESRPLWKIDLSVKYALLVKYQWNHLPLKRPCCYICQYSVVKVKSPPCMACSTYLPNWSSSGHKLFLTTNNVDKQRINTQINHKRAN